MARSAHSNRCLAPHDPILLPKNTIVVPNIPANVVATINESVSSAPLSRAASYASTTTHTTKSGTTKTATTSAPARTTGTQRTGRDTVRLMRRTHLISSRTIPLIGRALSAATNATGATSLPLRAETAEAFRPLPIGFRSRFQARPAGNEQLSLMIVELRPPGLRGLSVGRHDRYAQFSPPTPVATCRHGRPRCLVQRLARNWVVSILLPRIAPAGVESSAGSGPAAPGAFHCRPTLRRSRKGGVGCGNSGHEAGDAPRRRGEVTTSVPAAGGSPTGGAEPVPAADRRRAAVARGRPYVVRPPPSAASACARRSNQPWSRTPCRSRLGAGGGSGGRGPRGFGAGAASGSGNSGRPVTTGYSVDSGRVALASQSFNSRVTMVSIGCPSVSSARLRRTPAQNSSASA